MASFENGVINPALLQLRDPNPDPDSLFDDFPDMANPDHISISVELAPDDNDHASAQDFANPFGLSPSEQDFDLASGFYNDQMFSAMNNANADDFGLPLSGFTQLTMNTPPTTQVPLPAVSISDDTQVSNVPIHHGSPQNTSLFADFGSPPDYGGSPPMSNPGTPASPAFLMPNNSGQGYSPTDVLQHSPANSLTPLSPEVEEFLNTSAGLSPPDLEALSRSASPNNFGWSGPTSPNAQGSGYFTHGSTSVEDDLRNSMAMFNTNPANLNQTNNNNSTSSPVNSNSNPSNSLNPTTSLSAGYSPTFPGPFPVQNGWARSGPVPSHTQSHLTVPGRGHARRHSSSDVYPQTYPSSPRAHHRNQLSLDIHGQQGLAGYSALGGPETIPLPGSADSSRLPSPFPDDGEDYTPSDFLMPDSLNNFPGSNLRRARSLGERDRSLGHSANGGHGHGYGGGGGGHRGRSIHRGPVRHSPYPSPSPSSRRSSVSAHSAQHSPSLEDDLPLPGGASSPGYSPGHSPGHSPGSPSGGGGAGYSPNHTQVVKETVTTPATEAAALTRRKSGKEGGGGKMYVCKVCGKELTAKHNLQRHEKAHFGIKDFPCSWCDRALTTSADLKRHQKTCKANPELAGVVAPLNIVQSGLVGGGGNTVPP